jgi:hypothetical protein
LGWSMAEIIAFKDMKAIAERSEILDLFQHQHPLEAADSSNEAFDFPTSRPGISGNLGDLFEQANAVAMRFYDGDRRVPGPVAQKCLELLQVLADHAEPE